jgi:hypothetical protein
MVAHRVANGTCCLPRQDIPSRKPTGNNKTICPMFGEFDFANRLRKSGKQYDLDSIEIETIA